MNYMAKVANILGVDIGEYFYINKQDGTYFLCYEGLMHNESGYMANNVLTDLLSGKASIKRTPYKPHQGDIFWHVDACGNPVLDQWCGHSEHYNFYKLGNCYKTEAEAIYNGQKWLSFYASDEVLDT